MTTTSCSARTRNAVLTRRILRRGTTGRLGWAFAAAALFWAPAVWATVTARQIQPSVAPLQILEVRPNVHMITGAGANITVQTGPDGAVLVDSGSGERSDAVLAAIKELTDQPIRYIINTGPSPEHVGGNETIARAGIDLFASGGAQVANRAGAPIVGTEALLLRMSAPEFRPALAAIAWPTETVSVKRKDLFLNREAIQVIQQPAAHSDSDAIVFFRQSDVIATGDLFDVRYFPTIDIPRGGSIQGEIAAVNALIELTVPSVPFPWLDEGTRVIPGHGWISEEAELVDYRDMLTIIRDRVRDMIRQRLALDQIIAANPAAGFRSRYGTDTGPWTTTMFVEAVYRSLIARRTP
jgi:cyclase